MKNMQISRNSTARQKNILVLFSILIYAISFTEMLTGFGLFFSSSISDTFFTLDSKLITISIFFCFLSMGMLSFSITNRYVSNNRLPIFVTSLCVVRIFIWLCIYNKLSELSIINTLLIILYAIDLGCISAFSFYRGLKLTPRNRFARYIGFSIAVAVLLTMIIGKLPLTPLSSNFYLGLICQVLIILCFTIKIEGHPLELTQRNVRISPGMRRYLKNSIIMVTIMSFLHGMSDGVDYFIFKNNIDVDVVHDYYRLVYVISLITAAMIYDKFKYYQMLFAIMGSGLLIMDFQLYNTEFYYMVHYLDYICSAFILIFIMNIFAEASFVTDNPWMWCNLGRIIQFVLNSIGSVVSVFLLSSNLTATSFFIYLILLCVLIFMLYHGSMNYQIEKQYRTLSMRLDKELEKSRPTAVEDVNNSKAKDFSKGISSESYKRVSITNRLLINSHKNKQGKKENQTQSQNEYLQNDLKDFISAYDLTSKESDILKEILQLKSIKDMAVELDITERTVKYRISRIFEKTGTKNQRELLKKINE